MTHDWKQTEDGAHCSRCPATLTAENYGEACPVVAMGKVYQVPGDGQCFRACIASLLSLPIEDVPASPPDGDDPSPYWNRLNDWLRVRGIALMRMQQLSWRVPNVPVIVGVPSPTGHPDGHAIIANPRTHQVLHDPLPGERTYDPESFQDAYLLLPLEPWAAFTERAALKARVEEERRLRHLLLNDIDERLTNALSELRDDPSAALADGMMQGIQRFVREWLPPQAAKEPAPEKPHGLPMNLNEDDPREDR